MKDGPKERGGGRPPKAANRLDAKPRLFGSGIRMQYERENDDDNDDRTEFRAFALRRVDHLFEVACVVFSWLQCHFDHPSKLMPQERISVSDFRPLRAWFLAAEFAFYCSPQGRRFLAAEFASFLKPLVRPSCWRQRRYGSC